VDASGEAAAGTVGEAAAGTVGEAAAGTVKRVFDILYALEVRHHET
jgi:hypothetical protein